MPTLKISPGMPARPRARVGSTHRPYARNGLYPGYGAGLSHMSKELVEVSSAQPCEVHFSSDRALVRVSPQDVERDATQQREVLGSVVFPCSRCVLIEAHIQLPMQLVLDAPMRT